MFQIFPWISQSLRTKFLHLPQERIQHLLPVLSRWSSTLVGLILILIGAHGLREALSPLDDSDVMEFTSYVGTYVNGFTFGLQPDALMVILPALALPSRVAAATFLGTFLLGTIGAMGLYAGCIGAASEALGKRMPWLTQVRGGVNRGFSVKASVCRYGGD
jgi:putative Mn2+ efflux pump MntP